MLSEYASQWKKSVQSRLGSAAVRLGPRRTVNPWSHDSKTNLQQPQDGASDPDVRPRVSEISVSPIRLGFQEPEDARLTGSTRSLMRRLMGLNVADRPVAANAKAVTTPLRNLSVSQAKVA